jgi:hypothetical protein
MANVSRVFGFRPVRHLNGSQYDGKAIKCWIPAADGTATFVGDAVKLSGTADTDGNPSVIQAAAGNTCLGVIISFEPNPADLTQNYRPASQNIAGQNAGRWAYVATDPDLVMEIQGNGTFTVADVGQNASFTVGAGSTTTGQSGMQLDDATKATTSTLGLQIIGVIPRPDNDLSGTTNTKLLVRWNVHQYGSVGTTGV